jgi:regulator of nucleoside diphosphate kinase
VLTSIGSALLGLGPGQSISWTDAGIETRLTVLEVSSGSSKTVGR